MRLLFAICLTFSGSVAQADGPDMAGIVNEHIVAGYDALAVDAEALERVAETECSPTSDPLRTAYHDAFDAWITISHLRFGPSETNDRAFALAFWPDPRGSTPKALAGLIANDDPIVDTPEGLASVSIAARGFYALEFLLFDPQFAQDTAYTCALIQAVTHDIANNATAIRNDWRDGYGALLITTGNDTYRSDTEAAQQVFTALLTGLEFTAETRLGRPLGTFERPRPNRAEARRSERPLRNVIGSLEGTRPLAAMLSGNNPDVDQAYETALEYAQNLEDHTIAGISDPQQCLKVEILQQRITEIRTILTEQVGPSLGIAAGFNSMDGD